MSDSPVTWYSVVRAQEISGLVGKVNERIDEGWQPWGDMKIDTHERMRWVQVMVKYETKA